MLRYIFLLSLHCLKQRGFGSLAEWLGTGLQNRLQQFESARNLKKSSELTQNFFLYSQTICFVDKISKQLFSKSLSYRCRVLSINFHNLLLTSKPLSITLQTIQYFICIFFWETQLNGFVKIFNCRLSVKLTPSYFGS